MLTPDDTVSDSHTFPCLKRGASIEECDSPIADVLQTFKDCSFCDRHTPPRLLALLLRGMQRLLEYGAEAPCPRPASKAKALCPCLLPLTQRLFALFPSFNAETPCPCLCFLSSFNAETPCTLSLLQRRVSLLGDDLGGFLRLRLICFFSQFGPSEIEVCPLAFSFQIYHSWEMHALVYYRLGSEWLCSFFVATLLFRCVLMTTTTEFFPPSRSSRLI